MPDIVMGNFSNPNLKIDDILWVGLDSLVSLQGVPFEVLSLFKKLKKKPVEKCKQIFQN